MGWINIIGQQRVKQILQRTIASGEIAHAYLFHGNRGVGKEATAIEFARVLNCNEGGSDSCGVCASCLKMDTPQHPDVKLVFKLPVGRYEKDDDSPIEKLSFEQIHVIQEELKRKAHDPYHEIAIPKANVIKINSIREIRRETPLAPLEGRKKCFIIFNADEMSTEASNALLKTLEEPSANCIIILTTVQKERLPQTIISRCRAIHFETLNDLDIRNALIERDEASELKADIVVKLSNGSYQTARSLLSLDIEEELKNYAMFLRKVLGRQPDALSKHIDQIVSGKDRPEIEQGLRILHFWLRDALNLQKGLEVNFVNEIHQYDLTNFSSRLPDADLVSAIQCVDRAIQRLDQYIHPPLLLIGLALELKKFLTTNVKG